MKATSKSPKIPVIETVLVLAAVGLVGFIIGYVANAKQNTDEVLDQANRSTAQTSAVAKSDLTVSDAKLPAGWSINGVSDTYALISTADDSCTASVGYNPEGVNTGSEAIASAAITNSGSPVKQLRSLQQSLQTSQGIVNVPVKVTQVGIGANASYSSFGSVTNGLQQTTVSTTCRTQSDLTTAAKAVQAITVNHDLEF